VSDSLREAILAAGSRRALGRLLGISGQAIANWDRVPAERVADIERVTGISRRQLRPDLYGAPVLAPSVKLKGIGDDDRLREATRRAAARAIHAMLSRDPDLFGDRDVGALVRRLGAVMFEELRRL
jgi:DNA-binding transcriptional regulator YdaS (Cro superfamily)